jgi:hypothetical protein
MPLTRTSSFYAVLVAVRILQSTRPVTPSESLGRYDGRLDLELEAHIVFLLLTHIFFSREGFFVVTVNAASN